MTGRITILGILCALVALVALSLAACGGGEARRPIFTGCVGERRIALTFDDGPNPPHTTRILDTLSARGARATFVVTGAQVSANPAMLRDLEARGMAIAAHSYGHDRGLDMLGRDDFATDLARTDAAIRAAGVTTRMFRAPFGAWSETMLRTLEDGGYAAIGWSIDSRDWDPTTAPEEIARNVVDAAHPGAIVLMHDGGLSGGDPDRRRTIEALPAIIGALQSDGYELVTVPELTGVPQAGPAATEPQCD